MPRLRQLGAAITILALAASAVWLTLYLRRKGLQWDATLGAVVAAYAAVAVILIPVAGKLGRTLRGPAPLAGVSVAQAKEDLATVLGRDWANQEEWHRIKDPWPMPVWWRLSSPVSGKIGATRVSGRFDDVLALFSELPSPSRMIVIGDAGAGKSVLVTRLAGDLLAARKPGMPVPVVLSAATWDPEMNLQEWIVGQLSENHPGLARRVKDVTGKVTSLAAGLVTDRHVLPIIDGFDELAPAHRAKAIEKINKFGSDLPLVLASRPDEYTAAVQAGRGITRTITVEIASLDIFQAKEYLSAATATSPAGRWDRVFRCLADEPDGPLGAVLCTPLMLFLARTIYEKASSDPSELTDRTRFGTAPLLEAHLLDAFVPAAYGNPDLAGAQGFRYRPERAERSLGFLAAHLDHARDQEIAWWRLDRVARGWIFASTVIRAALVASAICGITGWILARDGHWVAGRYIRHASLHSIMFGGPLGKLAWPAFAQGLAHSRRRLDRDLHVALKHVPSPILHVLPWNSLFAFDVTVVLVAVVGGIAAGLFGALDYAGVSPATLWIRPFYMAKAAVYGVAGNAAVVVVVLGALFLLSQPKGTTIELSHVTGKHAVDLISFLRPWPARRAILAVALLGPMWIAVWRAPVDVSRSVSPVQELRLDWWSQVTAGGVHAGLAGAAIWLWAGTEATAAYVWLKVAVAIVGVVLGGRSSAALTYTEARAGLFGLRLMPWRVMSFLADARRRGVLRRVGAVYQFRHIRLQESLAAKHPLWSTRASALAAVAISEAADRLWRLSRNPRFDWLRRWAERHL
jgi:hypothetical protein